MLRNKLIKIISGKPDTLQFAKDRKFEEAWTISISQSRPSTQEIDNYLQKEEFQTVIVEYMWNSNSDNERFILTLFLDKNCVLKDPKEFINLNLDNFYSYTDFLSLINFFDEQIVGHPYVLTNIPDSVNLSVFNYWLSVGPVELWTKGEKYNKETVIQRIKSRPEIEKTKLNYQGLFFRFNVDNKQSGPYYGIKTPCCRKIGDSWLIDLNTVDYWIKIFLS